MRRSRQLFSMQWRARETVVSWAQRPVGVASGPARPRRAAVRRPAATRPWYVRVLDSPGLVRVFLPPQESLGTYLSSPKPGYTTRGSGRGEHSVAAGRWGGAGRGGAGRDADGSVRPGNNRPSCPQGHRRQLSAMIGQKHEKAKSHVNRWGNTTSG